MVPRDHLLGFASERGELLQAKDGNTVNVTISGGLAGYPQDGLHEEELLAVADARLFEAKGLGRNRIVEGSTSSLSPAGDTDGR